MNNIFLYIFCLAIALNASSVFATAFSGWEVTRSSGVLFLDGKKVFETTTRLLSFPPGLRDDQKIDLAFYIADYYLLKGDKEGVANVLFLLRSEKEDFRFADFLISALWKIKKGDFEGAKKKLTEFKSISSSSSQKTLAELIALSIAPNSSKSETDLSKNLSCTKSQNYYSICRFVKLQNQIDHLINDTKNSHRNFLNLDRVLAPFFEESILQSPHLIHWIYPSLNQKLAYLGFADEALHFEKLILTKEEITNSLKTSTFERISFYQMMVGNLIGAEEILRQSLKTGYAKTPEEKNQIYLKLGAIAYLRKDYKQSLNYYLNLNFKKWDASIYHPLRFEPISREMAKDLISMTIWKLQGSVKAVKALKLIKKSNSKLSEEELLIKARMAQIIFSDKPEAAEKIAEEVIYTAQSRGWKRAEYAGTLLQGYIHTINKNYRKSVIHFTKSYGILGETDPEMTSEWIRLNGVVSAHLASGESAPIEKFLQSLMKHIRTTPEIDNLSEAKYFLDSRFNRESLVKKSIIYFTETKQYSSLLNLLYSFGRSGYHELSLNSKGILQIPFVHRRLKLFSSFRPKQDDRFDRSLNDIRQKEADESQLHFDYFDEEYFTAFKNPILAGLAFQKEVYLILYRPEKSLENRWKMQKFTSSDYKSSAFKKTLTEFSESIPKNQVLQIYLNTVGLDIYQFLKSKESLKCALFHNFAKNNNETSPLVPVTISQNILPNPIKNYDLENFEGSRTFNESHRLHLWNFHGIKNGDSLDLESYQWITPNKQSISFKRMRRRLDRRMTPDALLFTSESLKKSFWDSLSSDFYPFCDFWFRRGTKTLYYFPTLNLEKEKHLELIKIFSNPISTPENVFQNLEKINSITDSVVLIQSSPK